jgi:hypothetical protein
LYARCGVTSIPSNILEFYREKHIERNLLNLSKELTLVAADFVRQLLNPIPSERYVVIRIIIILL